MNLPDKCPFCGADIAVTGHGEKCVDEKWVAFDCITSIHGGVPQLHWQSPTCKDRERVQLRARVAELEARCKRLETAGDAMLSAWLMPEDSMSYSDWVCISSDAKSGWYAAKETKP